MMFPVFPANVNMFFKLIIPMLTFDVLESEISTQLVFNFDEEWNDRMV